MRKENAGLMDFSSFGGAVARLVLVAVVAFVIYMLAFGGGLT